ncbi:MAG: cystathionine beta-synthase, partial [Dokdonia donghaensis]|nr:cystathionine beta-synthase [Dokdonia donghaensis]
MLAYIKEVLKEMPQDWLRLTTHRLDIYDESQAKSQFLYEFEKLYNNNVSDQESLSQLPTAYDYIRLGHPLSSILEWAIAKTYDLKTESVISFQSKTVPVLAVLRKNLLENKSTRILYTGALSSRFDTTALKEVYGYNFELQKLGNVDDITPFNGSTILLSEQQKIATTALHKEVDFYVNTYGDLGSILIINGENNNHYVADIQHVRRRETVAMTPENTLVALESLVNTTDFTAKKSTKEADKVKVLSTIKEITQANSKALVGSSGLSIQYAIMMGLVAEAQEQYPGKAIKFVVPPNCYGGTNDQARRVAACLNLVEVV